MRFIVCYYFTFRLKKAPQPLLFRIKRRENRERKRFLQTPQARINTGLFRRFVLFPFAIRTYILNDFIQRFSTPVLLIIVIIHIAFGYTMDVYQNLISGDKTWRIVWGRRFRQILLSIYIVCPLLTQNQLLIKATSNIVIF